MNLFLIKTKLKNQFPIIPQTFEPHPQKAAVLVILYPKQGTTHVLMTKRALHLNSHPGEIGFPGGVYEEDDNENLLATALRETNEEIGVQVESSKVIAQLPIVNTRLGFEITPFVSILPETPVFKPEKDEVEEILEIPYNSLLAKKQRDLGSKPEQNMVIYWFKHHRIWGASAKILQKIQHFSVY